MPSTMKIMYLNLYKLTPSQFSFFFSMDFDSKLKINVYHEHFPEAKYTRFPKFTLIFSNSYVRIKRRGYVAAGLYGV